MLVVAAVSLMLCLLLFSSVVFSFYQQVSKQIVCFFFFCLFFFFSSLSLSPILLFSLSCFLCPLVLSVIVWLNKRVYKIKLINLKKIKKYVNLVYS